MKLNKNYIIAGTSLMLILLLIAMTATGVLFLLPRQLYLIINGTLPLTILALLIIALFALMTGRPERTSEKVISSAVIIGLLVIIAGIFVPILYFEAFVHNKGEAYQIPDSPNNYNPYSEDNTTLIDIFNKDGWGMMLKPDNPDYNTIKAECLEQISSIETQVKTGLSREEMIGIKQNHSYVAINFPAQTTFNTSGNSGGSPGMITIDEAIFFLDSDYNNMIFTLSQSCTIIWNASGDRERLRELVEPIFLGFSGPSPIAQT